jgi:hypothetical protein
MNEIKLNVDGKNYRLTNNSTKYDRAVKEAGENASPKQILAHYDKHGGYIQNDQGEKIQNGLFWEQEKENVSLREKRMNKIKTVFEITKHPVIATILVTLFFAILLYVFGIDLRSF